MVWCNWFLGWGIKRKREKQEKREKIKEKNKEKRIQRKKELKYNLNNIGNLVNACKECNGPKGKWYIFFPTKKYWHELHSRNEQMCNSEKPLELTLQSNLGKTKDERFQKLIELRDLCKELHMLEWEGPSEMHGLLHYKF